MVSLSPQSSKRSVVCPPATALTIPYVSSLSQSVCLIWEFPAFLLHFLPPFPFRFGVSFHFIEVTLTFTLIVRFSPPSLSFHTFPTFYPIEQCLVHLFSWILLFCPMLSCLPPVTPSLQPTSNGCTQILCLSTNLFDRKSEPHTLPCFGCLVTPTMQTKHWFRTERSDSRSRSPKSDV